MRLWRETEMPVRLRERTLFQSALWEGDSSVSPTPQPFSHAGFWKYVPKEQQSGVGFALIEPVGRR